MLLPLDHHSKSFLERECGRHGDHEEPHKPVHGESEYAERGFGVSHFDPLDLRRGDAAAGIPESFDRRPYTLAGNVARARAGLDIPGDSLPAYVEAKFARCIGARAD